MGRQPRTEYYSAFSQREDQEVVVDPYDPEPVRDIGSKLASAPGEPADNVKAKGKTGRERKRDTRLHQLVDIQSR